ncbi:MAG: hypothetical protein ACE37F_02510 [Nannocystaceae bacterium]|nr:hypothetical protein [bacterium]
MKLFAPYFDRSSSAPVAALLSVVLGSCQPAEAFECSRDADCTLAGAQGICAPTSRCAYPNEDCASGYAYPEGAGPSLGGVCLPPGAVESGGAGDTDTETDTASSTSSTGDSGTGGT